MTDVNYKLSVYILLKYFILHEIRDTTQTSCVRCRTKKYHTSKIDNSLYNSYIWAIHDLMET